MTWRTRSSFDRSSQMRDSTAKRTVLPHLHSAGSGRCRPWITQQRGLSPAVLADDAVAVARRADDPVHVVGGSSLCRSVRSRARETTCACSARHGHALELQLTRKARHVGEFLGRRATCGSLGCQHSARGAAREPRQLAAQLAFLLGWARLSIALHALHDVGRESARTAPPVYRTPHGTPARGTKRSHHPNSVPAPFSSGFSDGLPATDSAHPDGSYFVQRRARPQSPRAAAEVHSLALPARQRSTCASQ